MGVPVASLRLSQTYTIGGEYFLIVGFGRRRLLEEAGIAVPASIGPDKMCVVCLRKGASAPDIVRSAEAFAKDAEPCVGRGGAL
jgi:hypothetical protein